LAICVQGGAPLILIADVATGQILVEIVEVPSVNTIDWSPDGRLLAGIVASSPVARAIGRLGLWDSATGEKLNDYLIGETSPLFLGWHPSEPKVAFTTLGQVVVFDVENWRELYRLPADEIGATSVAWSPVGDVLASVGAEGLVCVWDGDTGDLLREIKSGVFGSEQPRVFWSQDGNLVGATAGNRIEAWVAKSGQQTFSEEIPQQIIGAVLRPDGRLMVATSRGGVITLETPLSQTRRE
jgi:WD40 repeat protein